MVVMGGVVVLARLDGAQRYVGRETAALVWRNFERSGLSCSSAHLQSRTRRRARRLKYKNHRGGPGGRRVVGCTETVVCACSQGQAKQNAGKVEQQDEKKSLLILSAVNVEVRQVVLCCLSLGVEGGSGAD